ncbi:tumor necrosis factor receptor superfamily member 16 [Paramuricea clavata]|uniref:Tumor necrosis factor receptor superfamily member 16 n=1 Tax=Paramuricea clavata TaxID=317549 RepID=A0A7D9J0G3_PARCT|nr:tumor necrosis factor receptor superfamily member 16 [Paramuricea clavata]
MAENVDWKNSLTKKATNEPSENPLQESEYTGSSYKDDNHAHSVVTGMQRLEFERRDNNGGKGGALSTPGDGQELCQKKYLKIFDINSEVFIKACNLLRIHQVQGRGWQGLAGRLGYNVEQVLIFETETNGAKSMLCDWNNDRNNYLEKLVKELRELRRADVAELLQKEIDKKGESCNCPNCGHIV